jgi:predicted lipoprotein with Yx(FWY)xxD motif
MRPTRYLSAATALSLVAITLAACGGDDGGGSSTAPPTTANGRPATIGVATNGDLGKILENSGGRTLYLFAKDTGTTSTCTGACAEQWPPLRATGKPTVGAGVDDAIVGTTQRDDGQEQVTYDGHPLYTFAGDTKAGETNGQGINAFGGAWFAVSPNGSEITATGSNGGATGY